MADNYVILEEQPTKAPELRYPAELNLAQRICWWTTASYPEKELERIMPNWLDVMEKDFAEALEHIRTNKLTRAMSKQPTNVEYLEAVAILDAMQ